LNKPVVYLATSATHAHIADDVDTRELKGDLSHVIDNTLNNDLTSLPVALPKPTSPIDVGNLVTEPIPNNIPIDVDKNRVSGNVTVMWSAYNGNKTASLTQLLNSMTEESRADANLSLDEQYTTLTKRYFQTQLAIMAAYLRADALNAIRATDHAAQRALDVGLISKVERLEAKKALADAEYENSKALNDAELAMTALQRLLRTPYFIKPTSPLFVSTKPLPPLSYFQQQAKMHHPGFDKVAAKYNQAKALHEFSESAYKPNVTVFGRSEIDADPNWIAGVSANWKLWGGVDRRTSTQSSLAKLHQAEFSQVDVNDNIMLLVEKNWQTVNNARDNFIALNTNIELASEMLRFRQLGFKEGVNTAVEVMQAEANLEKAKTEQAKAANDYVQAMADLMQSCGTPLEFNRYMQAADVKLPAIYFEHRKN
jgi:outer membrane protein TolC